SHQITSTERDTPHSLLLRLAQERRAEEAWSEFVQRYRPRIGDWCRERGLQPADADDVTQNVLEHLLGAMREFRYDPDKSFRGWLRTVTHRACSRFSVAERRMSGRKDDDAVNSLNEAPARDELARRIEDAFDEELLRQAIESVQARVEFQTWEAYR